MFTIETGGAAGSGECPDCGAATRTVWGFVHENAVARATYYVRWTDSHLDRGAQLLVSHGRWGDGTTPADRRSFGIECRGAAGFMLVDASEMPWHQAVLGAMLTRAEALGDRAKADVFAIVDAIVEQDPRWPLVG